MAKLSDIGETILGGLMLVCILTGLALNINERVFHPEVRAARLAAEREAKAAEAKAEADAEAKRVADRQAKRLKEEADARARSAAGDRAVAYAGEVADYALLLGDGIGCGIDVSVQTERVGAWLDQIAPPGSREQEILLPLMMKGMRDSAQRRRFSDANSCEFVSRQIDAQVWP